MNLKKYSKQQSTEEGVSEIKNLWEKIKINLVDNSPLYLEWLAWRSILSLKNYLLEEKEITSLIFNEDFEPRRCAPGNIYDLCVRYSFKNLVILVSHSIKGLGPSLNVCKFEKYVLGLLGLGYKSFPFSQSVIYSHSVPATKT